MANENAKKDGNFVPVLMGITADSAQETRMLRVDPNTNRVLVTATGVGTGTVTSIDISGGTTGLTASGGPVISAGTITLAGILGAANGGTGSIKGASIPLFDFYSNVGNLTTAETDLYSFTVPASQLANNGEKIESEYGGTFVSSGTATREIKMYFAGTVIFDTGALTLSLSSQWTMYSTIIRVSSTIIRYMISFTTEGAALSAYTAAGELTGLTLSNTNILKITGQAAGIGTATNDIVAKIGTGEWKPAA